MSLLTLRFLHCGSRQKCLQLAMTGLHIFVLTTCECWRAAGNSASGNLHQSIIVALNSHTIIIIYDLYMHTYKKKVNGLLWDLRLRKLRYKMRNFRIWTRNSKRAVDGDTPSVCEPSATHFAIWYAGIIPFEIRRFSGMCGWNFVWTFATERKFYCLWKSLDQN